MAEKYIKASECEKYFYEHLDDLHMAGAMNAIDEMPSADVVEVVRCKDCIYYNETHEACDCDEKAISSLGIFFPNADDFCSYGERKELDNDTH